MTFVEAESSKIGERILPPSLWARMVDASRVHVTAPLEARSAFLCRAYADLTQDKTVLAHLLDKLRPYHSRDQIDQWQMQAQTGEWPSLAAGLIAQHYDPRYAKTAALRGEAAHHIDMPDLDDDTLARTAEALHARFR